jgi:SET domain-containing protein
MNQLVDIKRSNIHGKGVFASKNLNKGTLLHCDVLLAHISDNLPDTLLKYTYPWDQHSIAICAGFGSYFNHSNSPNTIIKYLDKVNLIKVFQLLSDIKRDEELTIQYPEPTVWFYKLT